MNPFIKKSWLRTSFIMLIGLIPGLFLFTFNVVGFGFSFFPGDLGDGRLNMYFLEHAYKFFTGQLSSFWDAPFMYPEKNVLAFSDNLLGSAPIFSVFRLMGFDIYMSYQLWFVVVSALNYISAFYFLKYVFKNDYPAVLGAFVFAFSIALQSQLTHAQTFPRFPIPIALLMAVKFSEELNPKYFFYTLLFVVYQIYCGIYLGFMLAVPVAIYLLLNLIKKVFIEKQILFNFKWFLQIGLSVLLNVLILLPLILPYTERQISPSFEHYKQIVHTIPTIKSHLYSQSGSLIWDFLSKTGHNYVARWDHQIFAGGIAILSFITGIILLVSHAVKSKFRPGTFSNPFILILTGTITFFLYMRFDEISAYIALYFLPGFSSMRGLARIINIELIFFGIATALVFSGIFKKKFRYTPLIFVAALALIICDNYFYKGKSYRKAVRIAKERTNNIEKTFAGIPEGSIVSYEPSQLESASIYYQIDAMLLAQKYQLISVNGYTATCPGAFGKYWGKPIEKTRNFWLNDKKVELDTLFVIKGIDNVKKVTLKEIRDYDVTSEEKKLKDLIDYIRTDKEWLRKIEEKALKNNIPVDSMLKLDAIWVIEHEN